MSQVFIHRSPGTTFKSQGTTIKAAKANTAIIERVRTEKTFIDFCNRVRNG